MTPVWECRDEAVTAVKLKATEPAEEMETAFGQM